MADINAVANSPEIRQHFDKYYQTFDSDRPQLASFYHVSMTMSITIIVDYQYEYNYITICISITISIT